MSQTGELTIDLSAVQNNWQYLCDQLSANVACAAVVKADAYGLGVHRVAKSLYQQGCRSFFVTTVIEGISLRHILPDEVAIYLLQGYPPGAETTLIEHNLIPVLISLPMLRQWMTTTAELAVEHKAPCAIKIDTGMTRLGITAAEFTALLQQELLPSASSKALNPVLFMSHLACADEPDHALNLKQLNSFNEVLLQVRQVFPAVKASLANSAGIFLGRDWHFDLVRPGMALYGMNPIPSETNPMVPVVGLKLPVIQLKRVLAGESVGYGATHTLTQTSWLATVAGGYADGIPRVLSNAWHGQLHGQFVPLIGRVSMDSVVFNVSAVIDTMADGADVNEADLMEKVTWIEMLNTHSTLDDMAQAADTIPYEIVTRLGERFQRSYLDGLGSSRDIV